MELVSNKKLALPRWIKVVEELERIRIYRLQGKLDAVAVAKLQKFSALVRSQKGYRHKHILLDFLEVTSISSSTVAALLKELQTYKKTYQLFAIMNLKGEPLDMIRLTRVGHLFPSYSSEAEAIQDLETRF